MEAIEGPRRQSGILSLINLDQFDSIKSDRPPSYTSTLRAAPSPTSMYSNGLPPPLYSGWSGPPAHSSSGLISPPDSRRSSDNKTEPPPPPIQIASQTRQFLPSIHEALASSGPKPIQYSLPVAASTPSHQLPYSQAPPPSIPRSYAPPEHNPYQQPPPQQRLPSPPNPPQANPFSRTDSIPPTFPESRPGSMASSQTAQGPHPNPYAAPRFEPARLEPDPRAQERMASGYTHQPPQSLFPYGSAAQMGPGGQASGLNQPRYPPRDGRDAVDHWKANESYQEPSFENGLKKHLSVWDFQNSLASVENASSVIAQWSQRYHAISREQARLPNTVPDRMPTIKHCDEMLAHQEEIRKSVERMKEMLIQQENNHQMDQRMRDQGGKSSDYDEEMSMFGDDVKSSYSTSEGKKRRGRAAPPGRCHSCNRAETPEWRRGPDGARTLCNACGLHYAKLTRRNTMKHSQGSDGSSSLRPKSIDGATPRPL